MIIPKHIKESFSDLKWPLITLLIILIVFVILYFGNYFDGEWDSDIFGGLVTEVAGVFLTFLLLESYINYRDRKQFEHRRQVALRSLSIALRRHFGTLFSMFKAASPNTASGDHTLTKPDVFFNKNYLDTIAHLDFSVKAPTTSGISWAQYLTMSFKDFSERLENTIDKYGLGLTPSDLDILETLVNSQYSMFIISIGTHYAPRGPSPMLLSTLKGGSTTFTSDESEKSFKKEIINYHEGLVELASIVNEVLETIDRDLIVVVEEWGSHVAPQIGEARIQS